MSQPESLITEVNKDTFWALIDQAKEHPDAPDEWLMKQLMSMKPEQAINFSYIAHAYMALADQYGLWTAANVIVKYGCDDDGFIYFRAWLVGQGKGVYMAALKDPDFLADAPSYYDHQFESLSYTGALAYEELTGRYIYVDWDQEQYHALEAELKKDIEYGDGIGYPYDWPDVSAYLPRVCDKYLSAEDLDPRTQAQRCKWNLNHPEIKTARMNAPKSKKITQKRGDAR